jgi:Ni2+-binding GTPase involved in maturation of urease and hydrogenase
VKLVTVSGPPSVGKTAVILRAADHLRRQGLALGVVKFDCLATDDDQIYERHGIPVRKGLSGALCPDHYFVSNIEEVVRWGAGEGLDVLFSESAGLCNRCSPYIVDVCAVCVIDNLAGVTAPKKIGPMLRSADLVVITKGDIVSQAEREVYGRAVARANPKAKVMHVNGITGQGSSELASQLVDGADTETVVGSKLRFSMPAALCSYCLGETRIGEDYQQGNVRKIDLAPRERPSKPGRPQESETSS